MSSGEPAQYSVAEALSDLKFQPVEPPPGLMGGSSGFQVTDETIQFLTEIKSKTISVNIQGKISVSG